MRQRWFLHTEWVWRSSEGLWQEDGKAAETLKVRGAFCAVCFTGEAEIFLQLWYSHA